MTYWSSSLQILLRTLLLQLSYVGIGFKECYSGICIIVAEEDCRSDTVSYEYSVLRCFGMIVEVLLWALYSPSLYVQD